MKAVRRGPFGSALVLAVLVVTCGLTALAADHAPGERLDTNFDSKRRKATVIKVSGEMIRVKFDDGSRDEWIREKHIVAPGSEPAAGAAPTPAASTSAASPSAAPSPAPAAAVTVAKAPVPAQVGAAVANATQTAAAPAAAEKTAASDSAAAGDPAILTTDVEGLGTPGPDGMASVGETAAVDPSANPTLLQIAKTMGAGAKAMSTARFQSAKYDRVTFAGASMTANFAIDNTTKSPLQLEKFDWALRVGPHRLVGGSNANKETIGAGKATLAIPVKLEFMSIPGLVASIIKGKTRFVVEAIATLRDKAGLPLVVPVTWSGEFALPSIPTVSLKSFSLEDVGITEVTLALQAAFTNKNPFAIPLDNIAGTFVVDGANVASLKLPEPVLLAPAGETSTKLPLTISIADVPGDIFSKIKAGKATYVFTGEVKVAGKVLPWKFKIGASKK